MSNDTQSDFTPEERELFNRIAIDVANNADTYYQAGQWLDSFYNAVDNDIKYSIFIKFGEASKNLTEKYKDDNFLPEVDAKKVIIITWLLTDPDAANYKLNITHFEEWKWQPLNDPAEFGREYAGLLFAQDKDAWIRLVRISWAKITTGRQRIVSKGKKKEQEARDDGDTYNITSRHVSFGDKAQHAGRDMNTSTPEAEQRNADTKSEREGIIEAKPPETLSKILWLWKHGRQQWKLVTVGILALLIPAILVLPEFHLFGNKYPGTHLETENILHKAIVVASATVEVKIRSDWDFNGKVANMKAHLAFVKGDKPLLVTSSMGYTASQTGNDEVVYKAKLDMDAKDSAVGNPVFYLRDAEHVEIEFGRMPSDSDVLGGDAICIINNSVRIEFSIPPQRLVNKRIFIRDLSESLEVLNEPGN